MVGVAQLVEHWVVVPGVAGSIPVTHPNEQVARTIQTSGPPACQPPPLHTTPIRSTCGLCANVSTVSRANARPAPLAQLAEQLALNQRVRGSSPWRRTFTPQINIVVDLRFRGFW